MTNLIRNSHTNLVTCQRFLYILSIFYFHFYFSGSGNAWLELWQIKLFFCVYWNLQHWFRLLPSPQCTGDVKVLARLYLMTTPLLWLAAKMNSFIDRCASLCTNKTEAIEGLTVWWRHRHGGARRKDIMLFGAECEKVWCDVQSVRSERWGGSLHICGWTHLRMGPAQASRSGPLLFQSYSPRYFDTKAHQNSQLASVCLRPKRGEQARRRAAIYRHWPIYHTCPDLSVTPVSQPMRRRHRLKKGPHNTHSYLYCWEDFHSP